MEKVVLGATLGVAAGIWVLAFNWATDHPHAQALMIFVGMLSAARSAGTWNSCQEKELNRD